MIKLNKSRSKIKTWTANVMVAIVSVVIFFSLAELGLKAVGFQFHSGPTYMRFGFPDPNTLHQIFEPDPQLFWRLVPGFNFPGAEIEGVNSSGFRGKEFSVPKNIGSIRIVCLGCSVTFGEKTSYPQLLQEILDSSVSGRKFEIINAGIPGYSSFQGLKLFQTRILDLDPDLLTVLYGWNDHWLAQGFSDKEQRQVGKNVAKTQHFFGRSLVYQLINSIQWSIREELNSFLQSVTEESEQKYRVSLEDYRNNLKQIVKLARKNGIEVILLTAPSGAVAGMIPPYLLKMEFVRQPDELIPIHQNYNQVVRQIAREEEGVFLVDIARVFDERRDEGFFDDPAKEIIHPNEKGYQLIAQKLLEVIRSQ
jgi:lysophospholipase L1-like esterase